MSAQGWNSNFANNHQQFGNVYVPSPTMLACRICDKIFLNTHSLIQHYESHGDELAQRRQVHHHHQQRINTNNSTTQLNRERERGERNFTNNNHPFQTRLAPSSSSSFIQQRYHPYYPNGYRTLHQQPLREQNPVANTINHNTINHNINPFLAATQSRHSVTNNTNLAVSSPKPISLPGSCSLANNCQYVIRQPSSLLSWPQVCPSLTNNHNMSASQTVPATQSNPLLKNPLQKRSEEPLDKSTTWYLGQLEQPMPTFIDLESIDEKHKNFNLDLTLKL